MNKIFLNSVENILRVKELINKGMSSGTLKKEFGIKKNSFELIKNDRIELKNELVACEACKREFKYLTLTHLKSHDLHSLEEYFRKFPNAKFISKNKIFDDCNRAIGKEISEETKNKIRQANIGKTHSDETKKKLSDLSKGDKNPSKRPEVREKLKANHISKTNPEKWKEIIEKIKKSNVETYNLNKDNLNKDNLNE